VAAVDVLSEQWIIYTHRPWVFAKNHRQIFENLAVIVTKFFPGGMFLKTVNKAGD
jgi:hypothetical protein